MLAAYSVEETIVGSLMCYCGVVLFSVFSISFIYAIQFPGGGGGGGENALYKPYRHVPPQRVGCLRRFGLKTGIDFTHFGLKSGMVFKGTTGVYERIYYFNSK